jgi:hypothetical protein
MTLKLLDQILIQLKNNITDQLLDVHVDVYDNSLSRKWLPALNLLLKQEHHLEKNYCWFGWPESARSVSYLCDQVNQSIAAINASGLGYQIHDEFEPHSVIAPDLGINHAKLNQLHKYFEDLQGTSSNISAHYLAATAPVRWHIRQLNLLCHELESLVLSLRKQIQSPEWRRPSQLMCWLDAPRFVLDEQDYELFGIDTIARPLGGVFVGVNKAVGKHHYEVFTDEGRDSRVGELVTGTLKSQTEAAGDFDIEWAQNPAGHAFMDQRLADFKIWLINNNFDPDDKSLTIGHPQVAQVDLIRTFGTNHHTDIWTQLSNYLNVHSIRTSTAGAVYQYNWDDSDYMQQQIAVIEKGKLS